MTANPLLDSLLFLAGCTAGGLLAGAVLGAVAAVIKAGFDRLTR